MNDMEQQLDSFDPTQRRAALRALLASGQPLPAPGENVNMHLHSFFSYNAAGYSPSHLAWEARRAGLYAAALCDFDVLDGLEEFLEAGCVVGLRAAANLETRAYLREFADAEISSPGEPGVTYIMGAGFARVPQPGTPQAATLAAYRAQAGQRNVALVQRINPHVGAAAIDYEADVVPLSPGACPTERHIIRAYVNKARATLGAGPALVQFWSELLRRPAADVEKLMANTPAMEERVRARLAKQGGIGYEAPTPQTFPPVDDFVRWVLACEAIPMATWLDGTSAGEANPTRMLECLRGKGVCAANIIPDRNWNIADPAARKLKTDKLREFVAVCERLHMPINIGTEMNKDGLPFVDDLSGEALRPYREVFQRGACVFVGHTVLLRYAGYAYAGARANARFGADAGARNRFFESIGRLPPLTTEVARKLAAIGTGKAFDAIDGSAAAGRWRV